MCPEIGGFSGLYPFGDGYLVGGTDGVGTKLKLAFEMDKHDTIGIDLVAMSVNDIVTCGAKPMFFLDYFATGALDVDKAEQVVKGIVDGCKRSGCVLLGGETAEMPGFYPDGEYDLSGFAVGFVKKDHLIDGSKVESWEIPPLFQWLQKAGGVSDSEMFRTFNMGIGMVVVTDKEGASAASMYGAHVIGEVTEVEAVEIL
eukprot:jgi/Pico_ML_1/54341/g4703.t1